MGSVSSAEMSPPASGQPGCGLSLQRDKVRPGPRIMQGAPRNSPMETFDAEQGRVWKCKLPTGWCGPGPANGSLAIRSAHAEPQYHDVHCALCTICQLDGSRLG
jgi:hypothetical protein